MSDYREFSIEVPARVYEQLNELPDDRLDELMVESIESALDTVSSAEERREELHARRRGDGHSTEELTETDDMTDVDRRRKELRDKIRGGR